MLHRRPFSYRMVSEMRAGRLTQDQVNHPAQYLVATFREIHDPSDIQGRLIVAGLQSVHAGPLLEEEARRLAALMNEVSGVLDS